MSAVVAQGGGGTVLAALSRGLPLVLLPQGADQFLNARRVASAHAGIVLLPEQTTPTAIGSAGLNAERATPAAIGSALQRTLTDRSLRAAAQQIAEEIKEMDPPTRVIDKLNRQFALRKSLVGALA